MHVAGRPRVVPQTLDGVANGLAVERGARLMELVKLTRVNVDMTTGTLAFRQAKTGGGCPFAPATPEAPRGATAGGRAGRAAASFLIWAALRGKASVRRKFKRLMQRAGIGRPRRGKVGRSTSPLSFHSVRHSFNSMLANSGVPQERRQKLTGHQSATMTPSIRTTSWRGSGGGIEAAGNHRPLSKLNVQST
jgi:integrase